MRTHFVGRRRELAELDKTLQAVREGRGQLVLLVGEPGIGKTRTAQEFVQHARAESVAVHWGLCHDESGVPAFWPWTQLIRSYAQSVEPDALREDLGPGTRMIAQLVPSLLDTLEVPERTGAIPFEARFHFFDAVAQLFRRASRRAPLTLVIDDLHWADETSLHLLRFVAKELRDVPVLLLGTARRFRGERDSPRVKLYAELTRVGSRVRLGGLDAEAVGKLMSDVTETVASPEMIAAIHERTRGNPFFVDELMRLSLEDAALPDATPENVRIPDEVRTAILRRLDHLDAADRAILGAAAVIGREFDVDLLESVAGASVGALRDLLESPALAGIVEPVPEPRTGYRFYHALVRETLYADLEPSHRVAHHRRVGEALEKLAPEAGAYLSAVAYHFVEARRGGEAVPAAAFAQRAGDRAIELFAYEQAASHYRDAIEVLRHEDTDEARALELLLSLGEAHSMAGESKLARRSFEHAADEARRQDSGVGLARAALGRARAAETGWGDARLAPLLEEALRRLPEEDSVLRAGILGRLAMAIYYSSDAETRAHEAVAMARRMDDGEALAHALICLHYVLWGRDLAEDRLALMREAVALAESAGDGPSLLEAESWAIQDLFELGRIDEVDQALRRFSSHAAELRLPRWVWHSTMLRATRATMSGELERAERLCSAALQQRSPDTPNAAIIHTVQQWCLFREQGRLAELEQTMRTLTDENSEVPIWRCGLAALYAEIDDRPGAEREFERCAADGFRSLPEDANRMASLALLAEVCHYLEDRERAEQLDALLAPLEHCTAIVATCAGYFGPMASFRALLSTTRGRFREAESQFEAALEALDRGGVRPHTARTRFDFARLLLLRDEPGDDPRARDLLARAIETARALGMAALLERAERLAAGQQPATPSGAAPSTPAAASTPASADVRAVFRREGDYWTIGLGDDVTRMKHSIGLGYIERLLREPGREFHVLDLCGAAADAPQDEGDAGEHVDPKARAEYAARLSDLREELAEAERWSDTGRAERAREEIDFLAAEVSRGVGLGGRARRAASSTERARVNATRALRRALKRISEGNPTLGGRLSSCIRTGTFCCYEPDPLKPLDWGF